MRVLLNSLIFLLLFSLAGCAGNGQFALDSSADKKSPDEVHLGATGLPRLEDLMKTGALPENSLGKASAPVTVIEYMSLTCPHCRVFHEKTYPKFKREFIDTGKVRYIVREFPIGRSAGNAAIVTRCGAKKRTFKMIDLLLKNQRKWVSQEVRLDAIYNVVKPSGLSRAEFDKCLNDQTLIDNLKWVKDRGRKLGVSGTPTFFINGQKVRKPLSIEELRQLIAPHIS